MTLRFKPLYQLIIGNLLMALVFIFRFRFLPPQIPLFYSKSPGEDQITDTWMIVLLPFMLNGLYFINRYLFLRVFPDEEFIAKIIYYLNLFLIVGITLIFSKIIFVIT